MNPDVRLWMDNEGVVHWRYHMTGVLYVCGKQQRYNSAYEPEHPGFPTCITCIAMFDRDQHFVPSRL